MEKPLPLTFTLYKKKSESLQFNCNFCTRWQCKENKTNKKIKAEFVLFIYREKVICFMTKFFIKMVSNTKNVNIAVHSFMRQYS